VSTVIAGPFTGSQTGFSFQVPAGAVTGKISVTTVDGTATSTDTLIVNQLPKPVSFAPPAAAVGTEIVITGTSLLGATQVIFTGPAGATPTVVTATSLRVVVPDALSGPITVQTPNGFGTSTASFKVLPKIISFTPASGAAGAEVIVTGTSLRLVSDPVVKVGAVTATVTSSTRTELRFTIHFPGGFDTTFSGTMYLPACCEFPPATGAA